MASLSDQINEMETGLQRLQRRVPELPVLQILASRLLVQLGRELSNSLDQRLRPHGLNDLEYRTLMTVYSFSDRAVYPSELCASLNQSPANITRITDSLVERGLITRIPDEQDRRRLVLKTTPAGDKMARSLLPFMTNSICESYRNFAVEDLQQLVASLKKLARAVDEVNTRTATQPAPSA